MSVVSSSTRWVAVVLAAIISSAVAFAEEPEGSIDTIVVTASRLESPKADLSQSVEILTREDIDSRNAANVTELLRHVPGLNVIQQGARGNVTSILIRGGEANFTVVLIDGLKINDSTNTRGGSYDFSFLDPADIERIEIVRGPMSALYGSDSLAGVINIITRSGKDGSSVSAEVGGHGLRSGSAVLGGVSGRLNGYLRAHALTEDGDIEGSSYKDAGIDAALRMTIDGRMDWGVSVRLLDADSTGFPEDSGGPLLAVLREVDVRAVTETHARGYLNRKSESGWTAAISLGRYDREELFSSPGIAPGVFDWVPPNSADTDFTRDELEVSFAREITDSASIALGGEWQREDGRSAGILDIGFPLPTDFELKRNTVSAFVEAKLRWNSALFQASVRWDDPDGIDAETSAQVGAVFDLRDDRTQLRATWGQGFKAPSFFALTHPLVGNPDLLSETAESMDVGLWYQFNNDAGTFELSIYRNKFENLIDFDPVLFTSVNRSEVVSQGAEFSVSLDPLKNLNLRGQITYLDASIKDSDARLRGRPNWRVGAMVHWTISDKWQLLTSLLAIDNFWEVSIPTGGLFLDGYERLDVALTYRPNDKLRLAVAVDNLLDEDYQEAVGFPAAGIHSRLSVRYRF